MTKHIDLRPGQHDYRVPTTVVRGGTECMGPDVIVTARDESHARDLARQHGHEPNNYFPPERIKKWPAP